MKPRKCKVCDTTKNMHSHRNLCKEHYNLYMTEYLKNRYKQRREAFIKEKGSKCANCKKPAEHFEIDHIDKSKKEHQIAKILASGSKEIVTSELSKCQILCEECHYEKNKIDNGTWEHGTLSGYRYCKCEDCKEAKREYNKNYKLKIKQNNTN